MKYRITADNTIRLRVHFPYILLLLLLFLGIYFKPVFMNYQTVLGEDEATLQYWEEEISRDHPEQNWHNRILSGFPLFRQKGIDLFLSKVFKSIVPYESLNLFFLLLGSLGIYSLFIFFKKPRQIALTAAILFSFSFYFFSFYIKGNCEIIRIIGILPWILFLLFYLQLRQSLLAGGLLSFSLIMAYKNIVPGLNLGILAITLVFWLYVIVKSFITRSYRALFVFSLLFFTAQLIALSAVSYPYFYLQELKNHTSANLLGISFFELLYVFVNLLLIFLWGIFLAAGFERIEDEETFLFSRTGTFAILGSIVLVIALIMRFFFDLAFIGLNFIILLTLLLIHVFLLLLLRKRSISKVSFFVFLIMFTAIGAFLSLKNEFQQLTTAREIPEPEKTISDDFFSQEMELFRIYPLGREFQQNQWGKYNQTIGGRFYYSLKRYQQILKSCLNTELKNRVPLNWNILNMLNVKYLVSKNKLTSDNLEYSFYDLQQKLIIYKNLSYLPRAWFVDEVIYSNNPAEIFRLLNSGEYDPSRTAIVEAEIGDLGAALNESIVLDSVAAEYLQFTTRNDSTSCLVVSEIYYPGNASWKAFIDGKEAPIFPVNYILRGLVVPAGEHKIIMEYRLGELPILLLINLLSLFLSLLLILLGVYHYIRKNYKGEIIYVIKK